MKKYLIVLTLSLFIGLQLNAQDLIQNYRKLILNSPNDVSLFQSNSTNGIWASGMIASDRWGVFEDATTAKERITILSGGNVGIGTVSPENKFHVKADALGEIINNQSILTTIEGSVVGNNSKFQILNKRNDNGSNWSNTSLRLQRAIDGTPQAFIDFGIDGENSNYGLAFGTRNGFSGTQQTRMVIEENGDVGIGTTDTQGFKLGVEGKIAATEVKIATYANWADYVFNKNYNLPALKDVEAHIKENGHLKDIPSAAEVKKDGFFLGDMDSKLLQKIEELTLYLIQQNKQIEELKSRIKELENK